MKNCRFLIFCFLIPFVSFAQNTKFERVELPETDTKLYGCVTFEEKGMLLKSYNPEKNTSRKIDVFTYIKFDTTFNQVASADVSIPAKKSSYLDYTSKEKHYELAYQISGNYSVSIISIDNLKTQYIQGKFPKNTTITTMRAFGDYIYFLGFTKDLPLLICQNIATNEITFGKIIPLNKRKFSIISFEINTDNGEAYLFTKDEFKSDRIVKFYTYQNGVKTLETQIKSTDQDKYIVSANASRLNDGSFIISGTYGNTARNSETSVGIFISRKTADGSTLFTKFINYLDINNFTSYLSERKQDRIEKKQERRQAQNKELELNYLMAPHKIIEDNGVYVLVGEAYYPTYRQECIYVAGPNGQTQQCYQVFDGFQYTHFFILGFNELGEPVWSNSAPLQIDDKPFYVKKYLSINQKTPNFQVVYSSWDKIFIYNYNQGENTETSEIPYVSEDEKLINSTCRNRYWYGNTFLTYGSQKIKNKEEHAKREIFFLEKINIPEL